MTTPAVLFALQRLVAADNCNYERDTMRHARLFEFAKKALDDSTNGDPFAGYAAAVARLRSNP